MKYSEHIADWLVRLGYTHCFYVSGGNIMHLLESISKRIDCRAVINEVAAGIAAEYFNETRAEGRAFALVTAGPGLTNIVTAIAGAFLESRELLVIGGQVKTLDLARGQLRQRGIQEIDGVSLVNPITVVSRLVDSPVNFEQFQKWIYASRFGRKGPVFLEIPLDVQGGNVEFDALNSVVKTPQLPLASDTQIEFLAESIRSAKRPVILIGGGVAREVMKELSSCLVEIGIPVVTTWNAADRLDAAHPVHMGRPNTWGQRSSNLIIQQADLLVAIGTRLGLQQTGFNWQQFIPNGKIVQVDIDKAELQKGHPRVDFTVAADAGDLFRRLVTNDLGVHIDWLQYARFVRNSIPAIEAVNSTRPGYISPFEFVDRLSDLCNENDIVIPCSSGGAFTVMMQTFRQKAGQLIVTNKALASMGYGLSGAIGASIAHPDRRVVLVEGDGGFSQNLQEIGTVAVNKLNLKIFIFDDSGYASIRMTQRNYFGGRYVGCDKASGLGLPDWERLFDAWGVPVMRLSDDYLASSDFMERFSSSGPSAFIVTIDPEQTYFPKIVSRVTETGTMESNPLHMMSPFLDDGTQNAVGKYL